MNVPLTKVRVNVPLTILASALSALLTANGCVLNNARRSLTENAGVRGMYTEQTHPNIYETESFRQTF